MGDDRAEADMPHLPEASEVGNAFLWPLQNGPGIATGIEEQWQPHSFLQEPGAAASVSAVASPARARR